MNNTPLISALFERLDNWRHLPGYRLEPRVDIFFSLYLKEVLQTHLDILDDQIQNEVLHVILPELPLRRGTVYGEHVDATNKSVKVDFVLFSSDLKRAYFIELKTDGNSRREEQDDYLKACEGMPLSSIVDGIVKIVLATDKKYIKKYLHLLKSLECLGFVDVPSEVYKYGFSSNKTGITAALRNIKVNPIAENTIIDVIYILPHCDNSCTSISFEKFNIIVSKYSDPVSKAFSMYLNEWSNSAGDKLPPNCVADLN